MPSRLLPLFLFVVTLLSACGGGDEPASTTPACTPKTCEELGKNCGDVDDGCGKAMACGSCAVGQTCGGGGVANVCAPGDCKPKTCAELGKNCGTVSDGCASMLTCGSCAGDETCGADNVCTKAKDAGSDSTPIDSTPFDSTPVDSTSVDSTAVDSGAPDTEPVDAAPDTFVPDTFVADTFVPDTIVADTYVPDTIVADTYVPDTLVADTFVADTYVADTYVADTFVADTYVPPVDSGTIGLALDVKTYVQSGTITLNGVAPTRTCSSASPATVRFVDAAQGYDLSINVACDAPFSFSGQVYPGTYKVFVRGTSYSNLPTDAWYLVDAAFAVSGPRSGIVLDVKTYVQSGIITLNGAAPVKTCSSASPATVRFVEPDKGYDLSINVNCDATFTFSGQVYPGTYKVYVRGTSYSNLPTDAWYQINPAFVVSSANAGLVFDVKTHVQSGIITLNGVAPTRTCSSASPATVRFVEPDKGYDLSVNVNCDATFTFSGQVYPGTYKVYVRGTSYSNLPTDAWYLINPAFVVSSANAGLVFDVKTYVQSGIVTLNGAAPTRTCSSASPATVRFVEPEKGYDLSINVNCDATFTFSGQVYPGTYKVYVRGTSYSNLPTDAWYLVDAAFAVTSAKSSIVLDVKTYVQSGTITLNGVAPTRTCSSASPATVRFVEPAKGYDLSINVNCDATFTFSGQVYPGTYKVYVRGTSYSNLPTDAWYVIDEAMVVTGPKAGQVFNVVTRALTGSITLNGAAPVKTCSSASPATVRFVDAARGYDLSLAATCTSTFTFSGQVYPGTYQVLVRGTSYSNLPQDAWYVAIASYVVL